MDTVLVHELEYPHIKGLCGVEYEYEQLRAIMYDEKWINIITVMGTTAVNP